MLLQLPVLRTGLGDGIFDDSVAAAAAGQPDPSAAVTAPVTTLTDPTDTSELWLIGAVALLGVWALK